MMCHHLRSIRRKLNSLDTVCPNSSTITSSRVWLSVPNLVRFSTRGKEQSSASLPSNEHMMETSWLLAEQDNVSLPGTAP